MSEDERKPELGGAVGRRATLACAMGEHDLCNSDPACLCRCHGDDDLYDIARKVTDEVLGDGTYAEINGGNPDPRVQAAIARGATEPAVLSTWTIFFNPLDHPDQFVVRRFDVVQDKPDPVPADEAWVCVSLEQARGHVPDSAGICFKRSPDDDPSIVETWM